MSFNKTRFYVFFLFCMLFTGVLFVGVKTFTNKYDAFSSANCSWPFVSICNIQYFSALTGEHWVGGADSDTIKWISRYQPSSIVRWLALGTAPVYLADDCTLVTTAGRRPLRYADNRDHAIDRCFATAWPTLWNSLPGTASATGHHLRTIQTIVENVYVWTVGPRRPVSER